MGGEVYLSRKNGQPTLEVIYWHPVLPSNELVHALRADTVAQLEDGIGEGGFEFDGNRLLVMINTDEAGTIEVNDDGRTVLGPPRIAIAARDGDLSRLVAEIEADPSAVGRSHQGSTALHLAILYGHPEAVRTLLAAGAGPNAIDSEGVTPLEACALSNTLDDEQSRVVGQILLEAGGNPEHQAPNGQSARDYAELRGKRLLATIL